MLGLAQLGWWLVMAVTATVDSSTRPNLQRCHGVYANGGLVLMVLASIMASNPSAPQFAKESVPEVYWSNPGFLKLNTIVSWFWEFLFAIQLGASLLMAFSEPKGIERTLLNIVPIVTVVGRAFLTPPLVDYLKKSYKKQAASADTATGSKQAPLDAYLRIPTDGNMRALVQEVSRHEQSNKLQR